MKQQIHSSRIPRVRGIWSSPQFSLCIVFPRGLRCTATQTRPVQMLPWVNHTRWLLKVSWAVWVSSPRWVRLIMHHAHWGLSLRFPTLSGSLALSSPCLPRL